MLTKANFQAADISSDSVSVVYLPTGQTFRFEAARGAFVIGSPLITGTPTTHPQWLMSWLARQTAQDALSSSA